MPFSKIVHISPIAIWGHISEYLDKRQLLPEKLVWIRHYTAEKIMLPQFRPHVMGFSGDNSFEITHHKVPHSLLPFLKIA